MTLSLWTQGSCYFTLAGNRGNLISINSLISINRHDDMMKVLPFVLYVTLLLDSALSGLPAPVNASVHSVNFHHVLHWDPGHGTPAGTQYKISWRVTGKQKKHPSYSNTTSFKLNVPDNTMEYTLIVQASYNKTLSQESNKGVLSQGFTLTPERTIPDEISIVAEMEKLKRHHNPPVPQTATSGTDSYDEEEEEEEEEGEKVYMDRDAELSSEESSSEDSVDVSGNSKVAVSGVFGRRGGLEAQNEAKAEGTEGPAPDKVKEDKNEEVVGKSLGNINLFSVTLAALAVCEEEGGEQNRREALSDFVKRSDLEPLLPTTSKRTLNGTDSLAESDDRTAVALMSAAQEDFTEGGYEARHIATLSGCLSSSDGEMQEEEEEEEEEEEFSGYMGHT
ncbi:hypothetical protein EYF80_036796 [Liparis tanakae]|uniref:Fibronectin type-III domain-containing protein n=1 Tax=Liparis tanakae TaxID=230148 RepID=A0A4Z2GHG0_9TELE|nr:hypothetical protein EYF80_036796 [Liparis tanakae]